jgi:flagella basal body P-ring formation protein FlgA
MRLPRLLLAFAVFVLPFAVALRADGVSAPAPLTRETLLAALTRDLAAHFNLEGDLQLELLRPWMPPQPAVVGWTLTVLDYPAEPAASMLVRCQLHGDAGVMTESTLLLRAALWRDTWVVRLPLTVGAAFDAAQLDSRRSDLLRDRDLLPVTAGDRTYIFARAVPAGRPLTWHDIARRPLVRKGDLVEVTAVDGLLVVAMKGLALENGAQGDTVTVRNLDSRKDFPALVTDENHVQIRF